MAGETLLSRAVGAFTGLVDEVVVAVSPAMQRGLELPNARSVLGGATRQESVYNLLRATDADIVLIHDAARPFLGRRVIEDVITAVKVHGAVSVVTTVADTLIEAKTGHVIDRQKLRAVQTPQGFAVNWFWRRMNTRCVRQTRRLTTRRSSGRLVIRSRSSKGAAGC